MKTLSQLAKEWDKNHIGPGLVDNETCWGAYKHPRCGSAPRQCDTCGPRPLDENWVNLKTRYNDGDCIRNVTKNICSWCPLNLANMGLDQRGEEAGWCVQHLDFPRTQVRHGEGGYEFRLMNEDEKPVTWPFNPVAWNASKEPHPDSCDCQCGQCPVDDRCDTETVKEPSAVQNGLSETLENAKSFLFGAVRNNVMNQKEKNKAAIDYLNMLLSEDQFAQRKSVRFEYRYCHVNITSGSDLEPDLPVSERRCYYLAKITAEKAFYATPMEYELKIYTLHLPLMIKHVLSFIDVSKD